MANNNMVSGLKRSRELLDLQADHRSQLVIEGRFLNPLFTRLHMVKLPWDDRYASYVIQAGLYGVHKIGHIPTDHALISALVERWRKETHTFHLPVGEMTITLQDVSVLLGLRVDGEALCLPTNCNWPEVVKDLLGKEVDKRTFRSRSKVAINISWLQQHFSVCPLEASPEIVQQYARAYCLMLVGSLLFTNHSGDSISAIYLPLFSDFERAGRYSWASGVLAFLYRELCLATNPERKQFGGSILLLQLWSWGRLPMGRPIHRRNVAVPQLGGEDLLQRPPLGYVWSGYRELAGHVTIRVQEYRDEIDRLNDSIVNWTPYEGIMHLLPPICWESHHLWRTTALLIHFWIVEMYNPDRVARQFGMYQKIPPVLRDTLESLHDMQNGTGKDWLEVHHQYVHRWINRKNMCLINQRPYDPSEHKKYMEWFSKASILYLYNPGGVPNTYESAKEIRKIAEDIVDSFKDVTYEDIRVSARGLLHRCKALIKDLHEPVGTDDIFAYFDGVQIQQPAVAPVHGNDPGPLARPAAAVASAHGNDPGPSNRPAVAVAPVPGNDPGPSSLPTRMRT